MLQEVFQNAFKHDPQHSASAPVFPPTLPSSEDISDYILAGSL
jgi:hypothetical protein